MRPANCTLPARVRPASAQGYSIPSTGTAAVVPGGFTGRWHHQADLVVRFSRTLTGCPILSAPQELGCDDSARLRGTALVGTTTTTAQDPGTWSAATLAGTFQQGFDRVVVRSSAGANVLGVVTSNGCELRLGLQ